MTFDELLSFYGNNKNIADAIGVARQVTNVWKKRGRIPARHQYSFEKLTKGVLKADSETGHIIKVNTNFFLPDFRYYDTDYGMCKVFCVSYDLLGCNISYQSIISSKMKSAIITNFDNLMQSTIFYDKNGTKLFDKDIIHVENKKNYIFSLDGKHNFRSGHFEIIGNIFEGRKNGNKGSEQRGKTGSHKKA